jgi:hypothetical protein
MHCYYYNWMRPQMILATAAEICYFPHLKQYHFSDLHCQSIQLQAERVLTKGGIYFLDSINFILPKSDLNMRKNHICNSWQDLCIYVLLDYDTTHMFVYTPHLISFIHFIVVEGHSTCVTFCNCSNTSRQYSCSYGTHVHFLFFLFWS